ncbi:Fatty acyl-CoA reductase [Cynara cardunculus var. scolymus]|uniref:Fatty acyl-CoA reductase n=1 Tax=Cynara cardunculus var. scolymus TaxID=59895 RepID=A0A124SBI0_CYNCS|nr:Fatty acyl-CoA reductase [Cynara cardunculus var. scolymus]
MVVGDVSLENFGVTDFDQLNKMRRQVDVVVNSAATTKFDERYDVALAINTLGSKHVSNFVNECFNIKLLLQVSTAFVSGEKPGIILEKPFKMGETLNGRNDLNIREEENATQERLGQLDAEKADEEVVSSAMKDFGTQRIIDGYIAAYSRGRITCFLADPVKVLDIIPADMVVNAMFVAMVAHINQPYSKIIYHVGSSKSNPITASSYNDTNLRKLLNMVNLSEMDSFFFDSKLLNWEDYFVNIHVPGLLVLASEAPTTLRYLIGDGDLSFLLSVIPICVLVDELQLSSCILLVSNASADLETNASEASQRPGRVMQSHVLNDSSLYDVALAINTLGSKHVSDFVNECFNMKLLLHISTAFVSGDNPGIILETPFKIGETLNGKNDLNIREEKNATQERLEQLTVEKADEEVVSSAMKDFGIQRAQLHGWPNTYVFTKAMGETLLLEGLRKDVSLVIVRPTISSSTYKEPFPGWIEGIKTIDSFIAAYGRGRISCFLGDPVKVLDIGLKYANLIFGGAFNASYLGAQRKIKIALRFAELFRPFVLGHSM